MDAEVRELHDVVLPHVEWAEAVFVHWSGDVHQVHRAVSSAVDFATRPFRRRRNVYAFEVPTSTDQAFGRGFAPQMFVELLRGPGDPQAGGDGHVLHLRPPRVGESTTWSGACICGVPRSESSTPKPSSSSGSSSRATGGGSTEEVRHEGAHVSEVCIGGVSALSVRSPMRRPSAITRSMCWPLRFSEASAGTRHAWHVHRGRPLQLRAAVHRLNTVCREVRPDVIHLHSFFGGFLGRVPSSLIGGAAAVVYQPHSWNYDAARHRSSARGAGRAGNAGRRVGQTSSSSTVSTRRPRVSATEYVPRSMWSASPSTPTASRRLHDELQQRERVAQLGLTANQTLLCLASLCWQKGQDRLVEAWEQSPVDGAELILVGGSEGPYLRRVDAAALRRLAPSEWGRTIHAVGHQPDVRPWIRAADVLVQPSRYEAMGVAVAEALVVRRSGPDVRGERCAGGDRGRAGSLRGRGRPTGRHRRPRGRLPIAAQRSAAPNNGGEAARARALRLFAVDAVTDRLEAAYGRAIALASARRSSRNLCAEDASVVSACQ